MILGGITEGERTFSSGSSRLREGRVSSTSPSSGQGFRLVYPGSVVQSSEEVRTETVWSPGMHLLDDHQGGLLDIKVGDSETCTTRETDLEGSKEVGEVSEDRLSMIRRFWVSRWRRSFGRVLRDGRNLGEETRYVGTNEG